MTSSLARWLRPVACLTMFLAGAVSAQTPNTLTAQERKAGWVLLFDGSTTKGWRGAYMDAFPAKAWEVRDGMLVVQAFGGGEAAQGGDIVTEGEYDSFDLKLDFKLTTGANSGIKYFVTEALPRTPGSARGLEFQLLDDAVHPDAKLGVNGNRTLASLYDLIPAPAGKAARPIGEWNTARVVVQGRHVTTYLNDMPVMEYTRGDAAFRALRAMSKFRDLPTFGEDAKGHILLQEHGSTVFFRNVKIRVLKP